MPGAESGRYGLKRAAALVPLSRDHHFALIHALGLRRAAGAPARDTLGVTATAAAFLAFYEEELRGHFADEEDVLLPLLTGAEAARLRTEHGDLHAQALALSAALAEPADVRPALQSLGDALHDHVRFEERELFEALQTRLTPAALDALAAGLAAHREARGRGQGCLVLPPMPFFKR